MQGRDYIPCDIAEYHLLDVAELPPKDKNRALCDMRSFLREGRYGELDKQLESALTASFLSRDAEQRYYRGWMDMENTPDLRSVISMGPEGLAQIKAWQHDCPESNHAWLAETLYWHHCAWRYRSYGWAKKTTAAMWVCAAACNEMMVLAALQALTLEPRQWMAAALIIPAITAFGVPAWLAVIIANEKADSLPVLGELRDYQQCYPEEMAALMSYSGLNAYAQILAPDALPPGLLRNQTEKALIGPHYWLFASLHIHPTQFYIFTDYIPFQMPRWRGLPQDMLDLIVSPACEHLSLQEKDHLRHLIWWDDFRDDLGHKVADLVEREWQFTEVKREAEQALNANDRAQALRWLAASYYVMEDEPSAWHYLQQAVAQEPSLGGYLHHAALRLAGKFAPESRWRHNQICHNAQLMHSPQAMVLQGYCLLTGLFGFTQNEALGREWLDYALQHDPKDAWDQTGFILNELNYPDDATRLFTLGAEYGARGTASSLGSFYLYAPSETRDILRAISYYRQVVEQNSTLLSQKVIAKYPLIDNTDPFSYEDELKRAYYSLARCYQLLSYEETDTVKTAELEGKLVASLKASVDWGNDVALPELLALLSELHTLSVTHQYLDFLLEHGNKGSILAMTSLAKIYFNRKDKHIYNYKLSARWMYFALALAPDDEKVNEVFFSRHARNRWVTHRYVWSTSRIAAHEIPGQEHPIC
ncbi:DUF4034 domain-containing protein [Yersinia pseudotuberculosis]|uniref:Sel1 domain protein repeat-containing protein n=3 Tax=Yersinia pseudotuberculosis complex TaxID=1649845 RepID=A0A0H3B292_YERPY|nr:DUF4034 domain-containing protein [Yersinia pseudotuberculosis]AJJ59759.1 hypothetical protein BZ22_2754 [Yersinia pseudotuberculosis YPIII]AYW88153.1 DUF4034 domain-containing protein [Yersinia pseudotuberculosis]AYW98902.1 DUF4034 domain-containing protein [Yersinia pseudotuberculosis]AZA30465.1 DUF4034 domain-containing protein [Yersinia pseudotuberculosis]MBK1424750.1 DUF4034 domain-containing protein [Yersinia pseudotuberculosis]